MNFACSLGDSRQEALDYFADILSDLSDGIDAVPGSSDVRVYFNPSLSEEEINRHTYVE